MALMNWLHLTLQLVHDLSHFLLFGSFVEPNQSTHSSTVSPVTSADDRTTSPLLSAFVESSFHSVAGWLGFSLPRTVTVVTGLPVATVFLLRLTEVWPAEFLLFLCLSGLLAWGVAFILLALVFLLVVVHVVKRCCLSKRPHVPVVTFAPDLISTSDTEETPPPSPARVDRRLPAPTTLPVLSHPDSPPVTALSNAALTLTDTVTAHHSAISLSTVSPSRPRRTSSRPSTKAPKKPGALSSTHSA